MEKRPKIALDFLTLLLYGGIVGIGLLSIYTVEYCEEGITKIPWIHHHAFKQLIWVGVVMIGFFVTMLLDSRLFQGLGYGIYGLSILLLVGTSILGHTVSGHSTWYRLGMVYLQPTEFVKFGAVLAIARYLGHVGVQLTKWTTQIILLAIILLPAVVVLIQGDMGSSLVFCSLFIVFYREGLPNRWVIVGAWPILLFILALLIPSVYLVIGILEIGLVVLGVIKRSRRNVMIIFSTVILSLGLLSGIDFFMNKVLKPHQRNRIQALVNPDLDPRGIGWNVTQSKIAIGSGGFWGKGFLKGTQTKYGFVPAQRTDFIFCAIGEEKGWVGAALLIVLFMSLLLRILHLAERQKSRFVRTYGYGVFSVLFFHFVINIGMTIGVMPVIGIPLPFVSYGGSSLCAFSAMLFLLLKFDAERKSNLL